MPKFFGRNVSYDGFEIVCKLGSKYPDPDDPRHYKFLRDGQITKVRPLGYHTGKLMGHCLALIQFPNISYRRIGGPTYDEWKTFNRNRANWKKIFTPTDISGKYRWENGFRGDDKSFKGRQHDNFIDFYELFLKGYLSQGEYENLYDFSYKSGPIIISDSSFDDLFHHEDGDHQRLNWEHDTQHASVTSGTYNVGSGLDYDDINDVLIDIGTPLTGALSFEQNDEETPFTGGTLDTENDGNQLTFRTQSGDKHSGTFGNATHQAGDGARMNYGTYDSWSFDETNAGDLALVTIQDIVFDIQGAGNTAVVMQDCGDSGNIMVDSCIIKGNSSSTYGLQLGDTCDNVMLRNNCIYDIGDGSTDGGIRMYLQWNSQTVTFYNNFIDQCYNGFAQAVSENGSPTKTFRNNIVQNSGSADYYDPNTNGWGTHSDNYDEDGTGPDSLTYNLHDGNSCFTDYANDDYTYDSDGDEISTLESAYDLTGTFTNSFRAAGVRTSSEFFAGADWIDLGGGGAVAPTGNIHGPVFGPLGGVI